MCIYIVSQKIIYYYNVIILNWKESTDIFGNLSESSQ